MAKTGILHLLWSGSRRELLNTKYKMPGINVCSVNFVAIIGNLFTIELLIYTHFTKRILIYKPIMLIDDLGNSNNDFPFKIIDRCMLLEKHIGGDTLVLLLRNSTFDNN